MPRSRSGFYNTIEYIGPRPQKKKRPNVFGGWVIGVIAIGLGFFFVKPIYSAMVDQQAKPSTEQADSLISGLGQTQTPGNRLAAAALEHSKENVSYDPSYYEISYPNGDVPATKGVAADVIVRCYRHLGIDLQKEIHEDMVANFRVYPQLWNALEPDANIDQRRVPNLQRFFSRKGQEIKVSREAADYKPGDIVVWGLGNAETHIGIVVPGPGESSSEPWVIHNNGAGVEWENSLFEYQILGHYRYPAEK